MKKFFVRATEGLATPVCAVDLAPWPARAWVQDMDFVALVGRVYLFH